MTVPRLPQGADFVADHGSARIADRAGDRAIDNERELLDGVWPRIIASLREVAGSRFGAVAPWLARLEPVALRDGRLELLTRSPRSLAILRERIAPLLETAANRALGVALRVKIGADTSLGGALTALGVRAAAPSVPPTALILRPEIRLPHMALLRIAREPKPEFDQLLIEGPAGVGKSLLLATFLWHRRRRFPNERWRLERGGDFFRDFSAACRQGARATFRGERIACDGFILDDAQELSGKPACQEQLVAMLEYFRACGRMVIVATQPFEGGPREFLPSLRSFLRRGLRTPVPELSAASRAEILAARARSDSGEARFTALAEQLAMTDLPLARALRLLDGAALLAQRLGRTPTPEMMQVELEREFGAFLPARVKPEPFDVVLDRCAAFVGTTREAVVQGARTRAAALGRHLAIYLACEVFRLQRTTLKRWLGTLSPSVLPYAKAKIDELRRTDRTVDGFIREVAEEIGRGQRFLFS